MGQDSSYSQSYHYYYQIANYMILLQELQSTHYLFYHPLQPIQNDGMVLMFMDAFHNCLPLEHPEPLYVLVLLSFTLKSQNWASLSEQNSQFRIHLGQLLILSLVIIHRDLQGLIFIQNYIWNPTSPQISYQDHRYLGQLLQILKKKITRNFFIPISHYFETKLYNRKCFFLFFY